MSDVPAQRSDHFISPFMDFLLVGGVTFFLFPFFYVLQFNEALAVQVGVVMFFVAFLINNPHFMVSYQLLYSGFVRKIGPGEGMASRVRHVVSGIVAPLVLLGFYGVGIWHGLQSGSAHLLGYIVNVMFFLVGWHYVKQGYGVLITLSVRKKVFFSAWEKNLLLYNGYLVWIATWVWTNGIMARETLKYNVPVSAIEFPDWALWIGVLAGMTSLGALVIFVRRAFGGSLSWNGFTGYFCALYAWTALIIVNPVLILVIPALHSLQYLLFVGKLVHEKDQDGLRAGQRSFFKQFMALGGVLGILFFFAIPLMLEVFVAYPTEVFGSTLFFMLFFVFINIHHYFIDFAIWRKENPEMKYLYV